MSALLIVLAWTLLLLLAELAFDLADRARAWHQRPTSFRRLARLNEPRGYRHGRWE